MEIRWINEKYSVSDEGEVFGPSGRALKQQVTDHGYRKVYLGYGKGKRVHRLVAEAFVPNPGGLPEVNHRDGDKGNNCASNLEWVTHQRNIQHAYGMGLIVNPHGEVARRAILTQEEVDEIRSVYIPRDPDYGQTALGRRYGVTNSCIFRVVHDLTWRG
jgi:HNH endonuclease